MRVGIHSGSKILERANRARLDATVATPYNLWELAREEADGAIAKRHALYRHALIHAGYLLDANERRYVVCPLCREKLG